MPIAPFFDNKPSIINKPDGSVLFECMCNANPEPTVKWYLKDKELVRVKAHYSDNKVEFKLLEKDTEKYVNSRIWTCAPVVNIC